METNVIRAISEDWVSMVHKILGLKQFSSPVLRDLFLRTYEVLNHYHKEALIPKEIADMLLQMDAFFYFASFIGEIEFDTNPYFYQAAHSIGEGLKAGFFSGEYKSAYPALTVLDENEQERVIDLEKDQIEELI